MISETKVNLGAKSSIKQNYVKDIWKIQCKLPPKTKRFCPLVLK